MKPLRVALATAALTVALGASPALADSAPQHAVCEAIGGAVYGAPIPSLLSDESDGNLADTTFGNVADVLNGNCGQVNLFGTYASVTCGTGVEDGTMNLTVDSQALSLHYHVTYEGGVGVVEISSSAGLVGGGTFTWVPTAGNCANVDVAAADVATGFSFTL